VTTAARIEVREAGTGDLPEIAAVALATGQGEEWSGADPAYITHLLACGKVVVGVSDGSVIGFGATRRLGSGTGAVSMLCDLFVDPRIHGSGCGRALLARLWQEPGPRMTFSSLHAHALPLYATFGLDAWWPLLYLRGRPGALEAPGGWRAEEGTPEEVAALELAWTGTDRSEDHLAWARRPGGACVLARRNGEVMAAATAGGAGDEYGVIHLALAPPAGSADAAAAVLAVLAGTGPAGTGPADAGPAGGEAASGLARVCLPGPHPAVRPLLAAGWRVEEFDLFMATEQGLLDPRRAVPSPALG
jgi:GNAT superfamily N-acetyltransferase